MTRRSDQSVKTLISHTAEWRVRITREEGDEWADSAGVFHSQTKFRPEVIVVELKPWSNVPVSGMISGKIIKNSGETGVRNVADTFYGLASLPPWAAAIVREALAENNLGHLL